MDFRGKHPIDTFKYLVNTDGNFLYDGSGSLIDNLELTTSYAIYQVSYEISSSFASSSITSSYLKNTNTTIDSSGRIIAQQISASSFSGSILIADDIISDNLQFLYVSASAISSSRYTGNQYGTIYNNGSTVIVTVPSANTYYKIDAGLTSSYLDGFSFSNQMLTSSANGVYSVNWGLSIDSTTNNQIVSATVFINDTSSYVSSSTQISYTFNSGQPVNLAGNTIVYLDTNNAVGLCVKNNLASNNITIYNANLTLVRLGD